MNLAQIATYVLLVLLLSPAAAFGQPSFAAERLIVKLSRQASATLAQAGSTGGQTTRGLLDRSSVNTLLPEIGSVESVKGVFGSPPTNNALIKLGRDEARLDQVYLIELNDGQDPVHLANVLSKNSNVEYAQPDYHISASTLPNDTYVDPDQNGVWSTAAWQQNFEDLWGLKAMRATEAWTSPGCSGNCQGEGVLVAVIDTGVDYNHPDIWDNIWVNPLVVSDRNNDQSIDLDDLDQNSNQRIDPEEYTPGMFGRGFIGEQNPYDRNGHGSHVAGTIAAVSNNGIGIAGVAPKSKIIPIKGLGSTGGGYTTVLADALRFAADLGARVINNSWGCSHSCPSNPLIEDAVRYAHQQNTVVIFAAGNSNEDANLYSPNFMGEVISVAAVTHLDEKAYFSNWGSVIDLAAPGGGQFSEHTSYPAYSVLSLASEISSIRDEIPEVGVGTDYLRLAGTSMAAPHIAGAAALLLSRHPEYGPAEVKSALRMSSEPVAAEDDEYLKLGGGTAACRPPAACRTRHSRYDAGHYRS